MIEIELKELKIIAGGKDTDDFYHQLVRPTIIGAGGVMGGFGGATAAAIVVYGVEGLVQIAPGVMNSLESMNQISDAELEKIKKDRYNYPD